MRFSPNPISIGYEIISRAIDGNRRRCCTCRRNLQVWHLKAKYLFTWLKMRFPVMGGRWAMGFTSCRQMSAMGSQICSYKCIQTEWGCIRSKCIPLYDRDGNRSRGEGIRGGKRLFGGNVKLLSTWGGWNGLRPGKQWPQGIKAKALSFDPSEIESLVEIMASGDLDQFRYERGCVLFSEK